MPGYQGIVVVSLLHIIARSVLEDSECLAGFRVADEYLDLADLILSVSKVARIRT